MIFMWARPFGSGFPLYLFWQKKPEKDAAAILRAVTVEIYEMGFLIYDLRSTIYEVPFTKYHLRSTIYEVPFTKYHLRSTIYEVRFTKYEIRLTNIIAGKVWQAK